MKVRILASLILVVVISVGLFAPASAPRPAQAQDKIVIWHGQFHPVLRLLYRHVRGRAG